MALPVRPRAAPARARPVSRASARISRSRLAAAFALLLTAGGLYGLVTNPMFDLDTDAVSIEGLRYTDPALARARLGLDDPAARNLFRLRTADLRAALLGLPAVRDARVDAVLPDRLAVTVVERDPILVWRQGGTDWLVDVEGAIVAPALPDAGLPLLEDRRSDGAVLGPGDRLGASDLEVARLLGAIGPAEVGSAAPLLERSVVDDEGWVLEAPGRWRAVFGFYTQELRPTSRIPVQVQCLAGLLGDREAEVQEITLATSDDGCGTYLPRPPATPEPTRP